MNLLYDLAVAHGSDKATHGYTEFYDREFGSISNEEIRLLEIGIWKGASLKMWADYFPKGQIVGLDINKKKMNLPRTTVVQGDQTNRRLLRKIGREHGLFDIIIDDGGHTMHQQQTSLGVLFKFVKPGGVYIIEDLGTSFTHSRTYNRNKQITTWQVVVDYLKRGRFQSPSITRVDQVLLKGRVQECLVWKRGRSSLCMFKRKK